MHFAANQLQPICNQPLTYPAYLAILFPMAKDKNTTMQADGYETCNGYKIRQRDTQAGKRYQVDLGRKSGKHVRKQFAVLKEARNFARVKRIEAENLGIAALRFSEEQRNDAIEALAIVKEYGANLRDAANFYARHNKPVDATNSFEGLHERYVEEKRAAMQSGDLRPRSFHEIETRLIAAKEHFSGRAIETIDTAELEAFQNARELPATSRRNERRYLSQFFNWAIQSGVIENNPVSSMRSIVTETHTPKIYTPKQTRSILRAAEKNRPELVPYLSIALFAGVRPNEILRLTWENIDLDLCEIHIRAEQSKTRRARIITIPANLRRFLFEYQKPDGAIFPYSETSLRRYRAEVMKAAKVEPIQDGARHSFATYCLAMHGLDETLEQLGHSNPAMLFKHYKGLARNRKEQAHKYFESMPQSEKTIIAAPFNKKGKGA